MATTAAMNRALGATDPAMGMQRQVISDLEAQDQSMALPVIAGQQQIAEAAKQKEAAMKPALQEMADFQPRKAELKQEPIPDFQPTEIKPEQLQQDFSFMLTMSLFFGAVGRRGFDGAMTAMNGAMEGYREGNKERFDREMATYKTHLEEIKAKNQQYKDELEATFEENKQDIGMISQKASAIAKMYDNQIDAATFATKPLTTAWEQVTKRLNSAKEQLVKMEDHRVMMDKGFGQKLTIVNVQEEGKDRRKSKHSSASYAGHKMRLMDMKTKSLKPIDDVQEQISKIKSLLASDNPEADKQINLLLTNTFDKVRATNMVLGEQKHFGDIVDRTIGHLGQFFQGQYTNEQRRQIREAVTDMENNVLSAQRKRITAFYKNQATKLFGDATIMDEPQDFYGDAATPTAKPASIPPGARHGKHNGKPGWIDPQTNTFYPD